MKIFHWKFTDGDGNEFSLDPILSEPFYVMLGDKIICQTGYVDGKFDIPIEDPEIAERYEKGELKCSPNFLVHRYDNANYFQILSISLIENTNAT